MILLLALGLSARAASWEPVDWPEPALGVSAAAPAPAPDSSVLGRLYTWYRGRSDQDGARCPYYPTCSGYGRTAVSRHGLVIGTWLTADRLLREYPWMASADDYPFVTPHGVPRLHDPVPPRRADRERTDAD